MMNALKEALENFTSLGGVSLYIIAIIASFLSGNHSLGLVLLLTLVSIYSAVVIIRLLYFKERPSKRIFANIIEKIDASSFPSMHSARAGSIALILGLELGGLAVPFLLVTAGLVSISRIYLKKHDYFDILAGYILGVILAYIFISLF